MGTTELQILFTQKTKEKKMFFIIETVVSIAVTELVKFIRRKQKTKERTTTTTQPSDIQMNNDPKDIREEYAAAQSEDAAAEPSEELLKEPKVGVCSSENENAAASEHVQNDHAESQQSNLENVGIEECSNIFLSKMVAQGNSHKFISQFSKTTPSKNTLKSTRSKMKRLKWRKFRKFIPKPSPQEILNKKLLARRRWIF